MAEQLSVSYGAEAALAGTLEILPSGDDRYGPVTTQLESSSYAETRG